MLPQAVASRSSERWSHIWSDAERRVGAQPVALVDELARPADELVAGHAGPSPGADHRLAIRARPSRPGSGLPVADRRPVEPGDGQDAGHARRQERLVGGGQVGAGEPALDRPEPDPRAPAEQPGPGRARAGSRSRATAWRARAPVVGARRTRKMFAVVPSDRWSSMVRKSASSAPARRASRRA